MSRYFDQGGHPITMEEWSQSFDKIEDRRIGYTEQDGITISTVWLGLDHSFGEGPPLIFETLVMGGAYDQDMERYSTVEEAHEGHDRWVAKAITDRGC